MSSVLFTDALMVTMNGKRDIVRGSLLVEGDRIAGMGRGSFSGERVINARGKVIIPGLIQAHIHLNQTIFRGMADDLELLDWLKKRIWPLEGAHDPESVYYSALLSIAELFRSGATSIVSMETVHHTESAFQAMAESGIRALSGKCMMDAGTDVPSSLMEKTGDSLQKSVDLLEKWHGRAGGRLRYAFNPRFALSCSEGLLKEVGELARRYQVKIHTHASENKAEVSLVRRLRGASNIGYLQSMGLTGPELVLAHCIWIDEEELNILKDSGTGVVHCPSSNLKLGSGIAPLQKMLDRGIHLSLGSDGAPCNNNLDPFMEMRLAALIHKPLSGPAAVPAATAMELATLGGARAMGAEKEIGSLETGKKADLVMLDLDKAHFAPTKNDRIYGKLVYQARAADVVLTMVDGRIVFEDNRITAFDEAEVIREAGKAIKRVCNRAGL